MTEPGPGERSEREAEIERLEVRLRRSRLTVPTYAVGALWFVGTGFYTGAWIPALALAVVCVALAGLAHRTRTRRRARLEELRGRHDAPDPPRGS